MNNPFDYIPDAECEAAFRSLVGKLEELKYSPLEEDIRFMRELEAGKMLGVLIAKDGEGLSHTLYAFSGQIGSSGFYYPGFVGPVFDYLDPNGYFKSHESDISRKSEEIRVFELEGVRVIREEYEQMCNKVHDEIAAYKKKCLDSKRERDRKRAEDVLDSAMMEELTRQSQFEKAELHRLKKHLKRALQPYEEELRGAEGALQEMKDERRCSSEALQNWLFTNFKVLNARGESKSLKEIFEQTTLRIPPSGAGECCAPKLLQGAYLRGWTPVAIAEYWYGKPKDGEVRIHGQHYPACRGKCLPVLGWMLQGLAVEPPLSNDKETCILQEPEVIFENEWFCVVDKPAGMLSVPGRGEALSLEGWLKEKFKKSGFVKVAHRLDRDTSGLIIAAFSLESYKVLQSLFARRLIKKIYVADLVGNFMDKGVIDKGRIKLPLSADWLDRPRQRVDLDSGKDAETDYQFSGFNDQQSRVIFRPLTGRTHQLRVHAASAAGLGMPIVGDRLYGCQNGAHNDRLHLHAQSIEFEFPLDGRHYHFESRVPF